MARLITYLDLASIFKIQKTWFRLQVESYISDWLFSESRLLASYVSRHKAMAYDRYGCTECMRKAADGKTAVDHGPGVCGFDCFFCVCDCKCVFMEHNRQKIAAGIVRK